MSGHRPYAEEIDAAADESAPDYVDNDAAQDLKKYLVDRWVSPEQSALDVVCQYALQPDGKLLRPLLLLEATRAVGGDLATVMPAAVGAESGHVASLAHDDIIDGDEVRRGRPAVHAAFGIGNAIVAGDALIFDMFAGLSDCAARGAASDRVVWALGVVAKAGIDMCEGQALEDRLTQTQTFDLDAYRRMVSLKTAAFFSSACAVGAILGGGSSTEVDALARYGRKLGQAFQIIDDLLPYSEHADAIGKPIASDARNGRPTLPAILARRNRREDMDQLHARFLAGELDEASLSARLRSMFEECGSLQEAYALAERLVSDSKIALVPLSNSLGKKRLERWADLALARTR